MKKLIISAAILLLTGVTAFAVNHYQKSLNENLDPLTKANIEAMRTITTPSTSTGTTPTDITGGGYREDCIFQTLANCPLIVVTPTGTIIKDTWHMAKKPGWI